MLCVNWNNICCYILILQFPGIHRTKFILESGDMFFVHVNETRLFSSTRYVFDILSLHLPT